MGSLLLRLWDRLGLERFLKICHPLIMTSDSSDPSNSKKSSQDPVDSSAKAETTTQESPFSIRPGDDGDLNEIVAIEKLCQPAPWGAQQFKTELEKPYSKLLVLTDDETDSVMAGFIVYWKLMNEAEILDVCIHPDFRNRGFGKKLVRQVVSEGVREGLTRLLLDVRKSNQAAVHLYQGLGFVITQIRKQFYSNGEDAYTMSLDLQGARVEF